MQNKIAQIFDFMRVLDKVCLVKRATLLSDGTVETDSSHTFKLAFMVMLIYPYLKHKYDYGHLLELALVHDIAEAETGDYPKAMQRAHPEIKAKKDAEEFAAMQRYSAILPEPMRSKIWDLYREYEEKQTLEAKLITALDKVDANMQANFYKGGAAYWAKYEDGDQYYKINTEKKKVVAILGEPIVEALEEGTIELALDSMAKIGVKMP
ncbi:MAG: HD domain-containing protein [Alphaproteobacteria bacterium]|nr:HD domain-containing protein [Alphaproteobacteria bacterium]